MRWPTLVAMGLAALAPVMWAASPELQLERAPVPGGAEILTVFSTVPGREEPVPMVAILRDTLGDSDPSNDRLRYLWTLTSAHPSALQHVTAAIPFFYWRTGNGHPVKTPKPALDLADTATGVWSSFAQQMVQVAAVDPTGALIRTSTRRYRTNVSDRQHMQLMESLATISQLEDVPHTRTLLSDQELAEIEARLTLSGQALGGLLTEDNLTEAYHKQRAHAEENRGHNWELLRQRAEANGLYFDPLGLNGDRTHAILWIAREDTMQPRHPFDDKFLHIDNPYKDEHLRDWDDVSVTRYFDDTGREVPEGTPGATARELIPLALYGLDYPKVPLLLIDFRKTHAPKREMLARATTEMVTGIIGYSKWGNWPYLAGSFSWNFMRTRHGAPNNRQMRLKSFAEVRRWLMLDDSLPEELRNDLQTRLEIMGVNPLEEGASQQSEIALQQYAELLAYAQDPKGLAARLNRDRADELTAARHGALARTGYAVAHITTFGIFKHREPEKGGELLRALDKQRRDERGPQPATPAPTIYVAGD
jgi:hypothetical protein